MPGLHGLRSDAGRVLCKGGEFLFEGVAILFILERRTIGYNEKDIMRGGFVPVHVDGWSFTGAADAAGVPDSGSRLAASADRSCTRPTGHTGWIAGSRFTGFPCRAMWS